ncbi:MAG: hypothetical protein HBSAPP04_00900 [Ignavibacteriaceae bacterium]|nr:MAG: hypothetical protein HBSAPP04_00900 [Ignavibacteriaceae bacterium]
MYCPKCGSENKDSYKHCFYCGIDLRKGNSGKESPVTPEVMKAKKSSEWSSKDKRILTAMIVVITILTGAALVLYFSNVKESSGYASRFAAMGDRLADNLVERSVPAAFGDKRGEFDVLNLLNLSTKFTYNDPSIVRNLNVTQADIFKCEVAGGGVSEQGEQRRTTEYYDNQGRMTSATIHFLPSEYGKYGDSKFYTQQFSYNSNGQITELSSSPLIGMDGFVNRYTYNGNLLSRVDVEAYPVVVGYEFKYNENRVLKWIRYTLSDEIYDEQSARGNGLMYDDQGRIKRVYSINYDLNPVDGYGHDIQYTPEGTLVKSGYTRGKKVMADQGTLHSETITFSSKGLVTSVIKYENKELKEFSVYVYQPVGQK